MDQPEYMQTQTFLHTYVYKREPQVPNDRWTDMYGFPILSARIPSCRSTTHWPRLWYPL